MTNLLDHTVLSTVVHCERLAFHRYIEGIEPADPSPRLRAGSALHEALAVIYREGFDAVERAVEVLKDCYDLKPFGKLSYLTADHLSIILKNYVDEYRDREPYRVMKVVEKPLIAEAGTILPDRPFAGIPDLVVEDTEDGAPAVVDHKTTTGWFANVITRAQMQKQGQLYVLLAREVLGFTGRRAVFNVIAMKEKAAQAGFDGQTFERKAWDYTEDQLEEARAWAAAAAERWERLQEDVEVGGAAGAPTNGGVHCRYCDYQDLCTAPNPTLRESAKRSKFEKREPTGELLSGADGGS